MKFPLFQGGQINGITVKGIPHFCLFDHRGKLIFDGLAADADKKLEEAVNNAPDPLVGEGPYKKLKSLTTTISQRKELGKVMVQLRKKAEDNKDEQEASEAKELMSRLNNYAEGRKKKAEKAKDQNPLQYCNIYQQIAHEFKGDEIGNEAEKVLDALKKDEQFQKSLEADKKFTNIKDMADKLKPCQPTKPLDLAKCEACRKKNQADLDMITSLSKKLLTQYPETPAAQKTKDLAAELNIKIE